MAEQGPPPPPSDLFEGQAASERAARDLHWVEDTVACGDGSGEVSVQYDHIKHLVCPGTDHELVLAPGFPEARDEIHEGELICPLDGRRVPIRDCIPRFHEEGEYVESFGNQWNRFRRTQIDKFNGTTLSRDRFYSGTRWRPEGLQGTRVLEVGCGAGRFTQILLDAGAVVYAVDYSNAVDACFENNGPHPKLCVVQSDLYQMPFRKHSFDYVFCYGVLQHTPDVREAFMSLIPFLKPGGKLAIDVYRKGWVLEPYKSKYLYRPIAKRMSPDLLFRVIEWYVPKWLPVDTVIKRIPVLGPMLGMAIPCWNYSYFPLTKQQQQEWAILDTFDALASRYDCPQTLDTVQRWFEEAGLEEIRVGYGGNGILGNGRASVAGVGETARQAC